jgi:hypothetical protein
VDTNERLCWVEARIVASELRTTRQLALIRQWRWLGQDPARLERRLSELEQALRNWHRHCRALLARQAWAATDSTISA